MARLFFILSLFLTVMVKPSALLAETAYSIKEMTPQVEASLESRRNRYESLEKHKLDGTLGENNHGYVEPLKDDSTVKALAEEENADRKVIYQTIADQNDLADAIQTIESVFAQVQREKAQVGSMVQDESGAWVKK